MRKLHTHEASPLDATGTIFTGAKIHTVDDNTAGAEAFLVFGNRFAAVGTLEECRTEARRLSTSHDRGGRTRRRHRRPRLRRSARTPVDVRADAQLGGLWAGEGTFHPRNHCATSGSGAHSSCGCPDSWLRLRAPQPDRRAPSTQGRARSGGHRSRGLPHERERSRRRRQLLHFRQARH